MPTSAERGSFNAQKWKESVRFLQEGDHYILVLCGTLMPIGGLLIPSLEVSGTALWIGAAGLAALAGLVTLSHYLNFSGTPWIGPSLLMILGASHIYFGILPLFFKRLAMPRIRFFRRRGTEQE